jgi:DNA-directed RNA polymerase subunit beta
MRGNNNMQTAKRIFKPNEALPRKWFGSKETLVPIPYLLSIPKESYRRFLQADTNPKQRIKKGLENLFQINFPLRAPNGRIEIRYLGYEIGDWECPICGYKPGETELGGPGEICPRCLEKLGKRIPLVWKQTYTPKECKEKGLTYSAPLRVLLQVATLVEDEKKAKELGLPIKDPKEVDPAKIEGKGVVVREKDGLWWLSLIHI